MSEDTKQKIVSIESKSRSSGTINNFICKVPVIKNVHWWSILNMQIPMSHYCITDNNNKIHFNDGSDKTATIENGFYTKSTLISELKNKLDVASGLLTFTITVSDITEKITISAATNFELKFNFPNNTPYKTLGFSNVVYSGANTYTAPNILNINRRYHTFNISSNQITKYHSSVYDSGFLGSLILKAVNSFASPKSHFYYSQDDNSNYLIKYDPGEQTKYIDIKITDLDNNDINFNGIDEVIINFLAYIK